MDGDACSQRCGCTENAPLPSAGGRHVQALDASVIALHDVELALTYATRIIGIQDGQIALDEASDRLTVADITPLY